MQTFLKPAFHVGSILRTLSISALLLIGLAGCKSGEIDPLDPASIAIRFAVAEFISNDIARANRTLEVLGEVRARLDDDVLAAPDVLAQVAYDAIELDAMSPGTRSIALTLIQRFQTRLEQRVGDGLLPADRLLAISEVLSWAEDEANWVIGLNGAI